MKQEKNKISRRSFFGYVALGAAGVYLFAKKPLDIIKQRFYRSSASIKVKENPFAVKRKI